jgi:hypothetical protein
VSERAKSVKRARLEETIGQLRKSKQPIFFRTSTDRYDTFDAERAKEVREELERKGIGTRPENEKP